MLYLVPGFDHEYPLRTTRPWACFTKRFPHYKQLSGQNDYNFSHFAEIYGQI